jgi:cell division transport system permease protein
MALFPRPDLPFDREDANRYLPWIIAVMTALTGFLLAIGIVLGGLVQDNQKDLAYRVQIQLPYNQGREIEAAEKLAARLKTFSGIVAADIVSEKDAQKLLEPWLGSSEGVAVLPMPAIIEVKMRAESVDKGEISAKSLRDMLGDAWPGMVVDGYEQWIADFNRLTKSIQFGLYGIAALVLCSAIVVILLITRASVQLHFPIVRLLHRIGAKDEYISKQFQMNATTLTLKGTVPGIAIAAALYGFSGHFVSKIPILSMPDTGFSWPLVAILLAIPLCMVACVSAAVQLTVRQMLLRLH